jgi:EAL domain-containing protein (putative c-di-GMP-specific phosphodiesterase class I)
MRTTAEGVETADQARLLSALGCDFGQGFLFARPMEAAAALAYWRGALERPII